MGLMYIFKTEYDKMKKENKEQYFKGIDVLYYEPNIFMKLATKFFSSAPIEIYKDLHTYIKSQKQTDFKFTQALIGGLPKRNMQLYYQERSADLNFQP